MAFKNGNITRILIIDFLTFDHAEVKPTPYLNMILGPNGTGKSTILCAVCICLGGKPDTTGRSKDLERYIKHGKQMAVVEVELFHEKGQHQVIKRQFNATGSKWYLNGKSASKKEVDKVIDRFGIQVDNLCQFLPQDRVASFARMNHMQLLEATEKAVGEPELSKYHELLIDGGSKMQEVENKTLERTKILESLQEQNASLKAMVENVQEKEKIINKIASLQKQQCFFNYSAKRQLHRESEAKVKELNALIKQEKGKFQPIRDEISRIAENLKSQKVCLKQKVAEFVKQKEKSKQYSMQANELFEKVNNSKAEFDSKKEDYEQHQKELDDLKIQLDVYEQQLRIQQDLNETEVNRRIQELTSDIRASTHKLAITKNEQEDVSSSIREWRSLIKANQQRIESASDVMQQRMELLRIRNGDAYKAAEWLKKNGNQFSCPFYMPMCTQLNIRNPKYVNAVEGVISFSDLVAFTFEDKDDMNKFKNHMDKLGCCINIVHSVPLDLSQFRPLETNEDLRKWGFNVYLADVIDAPPAVLSFLYRHYRIHRIPFTDDETINYDELPDCLTLFFMGNKRVKRAKSQYHSGIMTVTSIVKEGLLLKITVNQELINTLQNQIHKLHNHVASAEEKLEALKEKEQSINQELVKWRHENQSNFSRLEERQKNVKRIELKKKQIEQYEAETFDLEAEAAKMNKEISSSMLKVVKETLKAVRDVALNEPVSQIQSYYKLASSSETMKMSIKYKEESLSSSEEELKGLEEKAAQKEKEKATLRTVAQNSLNELCASFGVKRHGDIPKGVIESFQSSTLEETERLLVDYEARRDCMHTADEGEVKSYYEREQQIKAVKKEIEKLMQQRDSQHELLEESRLKWLPSIQELIDNISSSFTSFMERMGYTGEVELCHEAENDYSKYGICIKVKFRDEDKLRPLTAQHQSGGERAVATALYMMSLQILTAVPFRCVDEINQGMDPQNERRILAMLMEAAAKEDTSQYFFVSPKLLPDLVYGDRVNTMIVYNGPIVVPKGKFKFGKRRKLINGKT